MPTPVRECPSCGKEVMCDPTAGDDWDDDELAVGPDCEECEEQMVFVGEYDVRDQ